MILDLGCGGHLHDGAIGVDIVLQPKTAATVKCYLGFERIPFEDGSVDQCISHHFIEHIPGVVTYREDGEWVKYQPLVYLFNEIFRVLRHNGSFLCRVPIYPYIQAFQDPTHISFWTIETPYYFSGDYYSFHDVYGHTSRFEMLWKQQNGENGWWLDFEFRAIKTLPNNYPFQLKYGDIPHE